MDSDERGGAGGGARWDSDAGWGRCGHGCGRVVMKARDGLSDGGRGLDQLMAGLFGR